MPLFLIYTRNREMFQGIPLTLPHTLRSLTTAATSSLVATPTQQALLAADILY